MMSSRNLTYAPPPTPRRIFDILAILWYLVYQLDDGIFEPRYLKAGLMVWLMG